MLNGIKTINTTEIPIIIVLLNFGYFTLLIINSEVIAKSGNAMYKLNNPLR